MDFADRRVNYASTVLGRLKLKLYEVISEDCDRFPGPREQRIFLLDVYKRNFSEGQMFSDILGLNVTTEIDVADLQGLADIRSLIRSLEEVPLEEVIFVELNNCPGPAPGKLGMLIHREDLDPAGFYYTITLLDESDFPELLAGYIKVRCNQKQPEPVFGILESKGFLSLTFADWESSADLRLVVRVLHCVDSKRRAPLALRDSPLDPPADAVLSNLIAQSYQGIIPCYGGIVPFNLVRPHSFEFALDFPRHIVLIFVREMSKNPSVAPPMLVYWKADRFVMSDDYPVYLAHREIGSLSAPVIILGEPPKGLGIDLVKGGPELIPPFIFSTEEAISNYRLGRPISMVLSVLHAIYRVLSELIQLPQLKEKKLHDFLRSNPVAVGPLALLFGRR